MKWKYKGGEVFNVPDGVMGFVYEITYDDDSKYIGKKTAKREVKLKPTKKQLAIRKNYRRVECRETDWKTYSGSHKDLPKGLQIANKEILYFCISKRQLTYIEVRELFKADVLFNDKYHNQNINGKWFDNVCEPLLANPC